MLPETLGIQGLLLGRKQTKDHVSPHRIALLAFIKEFCLAKKKNRDAKQERTFAICTLKLIQNPDTELKTLQSIIEVVLHPKTYQKFLNGLQDLRKNGVASIMDFVQFLEVLLVEPQQKTAVVHKSSVLGLFIRRMLLAFDKLSFSNVVKLHKNFCEYYDSSLDENEMDLCGKIEFDSLKIKNEDDDFQILASQKQAEFFVSQQATLFHINEQKALPPADLQKKIRELLRGNPDFAEAHYLSFLNSLRVKEYLGALENLYHYFDRSAIVPQEAKPIVSEDKSFRYAALSLAILQSKFGHKEEALAALKEAINMAQEANDNICLQHALSWLYQLSPENQDVLIERSISKSGELSLWYLSSLGVQALAQSKALQGANPHEIFELTMKSDILNCHHSITELLGPSYAQRSALWYTYGNSSMGDLCSQILLFLNTSDPSKGRIYHVGEGTCLAIRNLASSFSLKGQYEGAAEILGFSQNLFNPHHDSASVWLVCEQTIIFERALHHGRWQEAIKATDGISLFQLREGKLRRAELYLNMGDYILANGLIKELLDDCQKESGPTIHFHVRLLLNQAKLYLLSHRSAQAISPLTMALTHCEQHHLLHLKALVTLHLAAVQYLMELPSQALHLLDKIYISIQAHGTLYEVACLQLLYAKCLAACSKAENKEIREAGLSKGIQLLKKSENLFTRVESFNRVKDSLYWQAIFFNEMNKIEERNQCAMKFRKLDEETKSFDTNAVLIP